MKLYNKNTDKIENIKVIQDNGTFYVNRLSDKQLNELGYFKVVYESKPSRRYYNFTENKELIGNVFTISYTATDKPLESIKELMLKDLKESFLNYALRPKVDTGLGFIVDGGRDDIKNFEIGKKYALEAVKDADGNMHPVTDSDYDVIISAIEQKGMSLYGIKWQKEAEINAMNTVDEIVLYEATPYEATVDVIDEATQEPTGETQVITKYKNNVKEWE